MYTDGGEIVAIPLFLTHDGNSHFAFLKSIRGK